MEANIAKLMLLEVNDVLHLSDPQLRLLQRVIDTAYHEGHMAGYEKAVNTHNEIRKRYDTRAVQNKPGAATH
jgi:hypothetical protein